MPAGTTINSERHDGTPQKIKACIQRVRPDMSQVFLQHNNAKPHTTVRTTAKINRLGFSVLDHPPYATDFPPSDVHLFQKLKKHMGAHHLLSDDEVKAAVKMWFHPYDAQFCRDGLMKLLECWQKCVHRRKDYTEK
jgi:histone-lysine N-methyltransferase SETMAR